MENEKVLLVWQLIPDETKLYEFDANSDMAKLAMASAGKYINSDDFADDDAIFTLENNLDGVEPLINQHMATGNYRTVVLCGFVL